MGISLTPLTGRSPLLAQRTVELLTALVLVLYCVAQVVTIATRIASGTDQPDVTNSVLMLTVNHGWYVASKIANLVAAFLLLTLAVMLYRVFYACDRTLAGLSATLFLAAGVLWLFSSVAGLALAEIYGGPASESALLTRGSQFSAFSTIEPVRAIAGRTGFTAAGLALISLSTLIALARPLPRWLGWSGWMIGLAMFFIWDPEATTMHRLGGAALLVWFLLVAVLLAWKGATKSELSGDYLTEGEV